MVPGPTSPRRRRRSNTVAWRPVRPTSGSTVTGTGVARASNGCQATGWHRRRVGSGWHRSGVVTATAGVPRAGAGNSMRRHRPGRTASRFIRYLRLARCRHPRSVRHRAGNRIRSTAPSHVSSAPRPCRRPMAECVSRRGPVSRKPGHRRRLAARSCPRLPGVPMAGPSAKANPCSGRLQRHRQGGRPQRPVLLAPAAKRTTGVMGLGGGTARRTASGTGIGIGAEPPQAAARCKRSRTPSQAGSAGGVSTQISLTSGWSSSRSTANSSCAQASAPVGM